MESHGTWTTLKSTNPDKVNIYFEINEGHIIIVVYDRTKLLSTLSLNELIRTPEMQCNTRIWECKNFNLKRIKEYCCTFRRRHFGVYPNCFGVCFVQQLDRYFYLIDLILSTRQPVLLVGESGIGKTSLVQVGSALYLQSQTASMVLHPKTRPFTFLEAIFERFYFE